MITKHITDGTPCKIYKALLSQTGSLTGSSINNFFGKLIINEMYTIADYVAGDDFANIADVRGGVINETGCVFVATGATPTNWDNGSTLVSVGELIVAELENSLDFDIEWLWRPFGGYGYYIGIDKELGPTANGFPREKCHMLIGDSISLGPYIPTLLTITTGSFMGPDELVNINVYDFLTNDSADNRLFYTPVTITIFK